MTFKKHIGIVGGGLLGMTLALRLREQGFQVSLLEASPYLGGLTSPTKIGDYTWDRFYHVILLSDKGLLALLDRLSLKTQINWNFTKTGFFTDGHLYSMSDIKEFLAFPPLALFEKLRLGFTIFYASRIKSSERLEEIGVEDWLVKLSGRRTFKKIWLPLLKSKLGESYRLASASFIWAIIARMYAARRSGLKKEMFGYVNGGYETILKEFQSLLDEIQVDTICENPVTEIANNTSGVKINTKTRKALEFDDVILTVPCNQIPILCPQLSPTEKERLRNAHYQGVVCLALILKKSLNGYYITNITDERVPFTAVIEMTAVVDKKTFAGNSLVYLPLYLSREDLFWKKSDEEIQEEFLKVLEVMYPSFSRKDVLGTKMTRAKEVFPVPTVNYSRELLPPIRTSLEHIFIVNSAQIANGTMNVNEIVGLANRKSKEIANLVGG